MADMGIVFQPKGWPLIFKVPALVVVLMVSVAVVISQLVLVKLIENQEQNLKQLTETYLDGVSTALMPHVIRQDSWETFDVLDRARDHYADIMTRLTLVTLPDGKVLAASNPKVFPIGMAVPIGVIRHFEKGRFIAIDEETGIRTYEATRVRLHEPSHVQKSIFLADFWSSSVGTMIARVLALK